jgi:8-oxo-dGTP diphosphatase
VRRVLHFTEYDTRVAGYAVITRGDTILLTWFNGAQPCWSLPGGGIEFDESVEQGVIREAKEESGYDIALGALLGTHSFTDADPDRARPFKALRLFYEAEIIGGTLGTLEVGGTTDYAEWVSVADLADQPHADVVDLAVGFVRQQRPQLRKG